MSYSVESLLFKAAVGVVNTAARAANSLLEVMYPPRYDVAHIWDELAVSCADPHPADAADPAGARDAPPSPPAGSLTWEAWALPAILDVLASHHYQWPTGYCECGFGHGTTQSAWMAQEDWREHVAPLIAARISCDPARAVLALTSLQTQ